MNAELSTAPNVGASIKAKQFKLYDMCYDYLIDNFHKFTEANKLKVSLALATKMAPAQIEGGLAGQTNQRVIVYVQEKNGIPDQGTHGRLPTSVSVVAE
jgi:hypothetical protein